MSGECFRAERGVLSPLRTSPDSLLVTGGSARAMRLTSPKGRPISSAQQQATSEGRRASCTLDESGSTFQG